MSAWLECDRNVKAFEKERKDLRAEIIKLNGDSVAAGKVVGSQGVSISTRWAEGKTVSYETKPAWVTTIAGPRGKK